MKPGGTRVKPGRNFSLCMSIYDYKQKTSHDVCSNQFIQNEIIRWTNRPPAVITFHQIYINFKYEKNTYFVYLD